MCRKVYVFVIVRSRTLNYTTALSRNRDAPPPNGAGRPNEKYQNFDQFGVIQSPPKEGDCGTVAELRAAHYKG